MAGEVANFTCSGVEEVSESDDLKNEGIPCFWLTALSNNPTIAPQITEEDSSVLAYLRDINVSLFSDKPGFILKFNFDQNPYFTNTTLTKEYHLAISDGNGQDDYVYDYAVGTEINWNSGKNLCFKAVFRTQRHRTNNSTRTIKREESLESFFHFFSPPSMPEDAQDDDELDNIDDLENLLQSDYEIGEIIKEEIVPNAVDWFTGKALEYMELEDGDEDPEYDDEYEEDGEDNDNDDDDEDDSEDDSDEDEHPKKYPSKLNASSGAPEKPECKQQ